jgi:hypothetical protein
MWHFFNVGNYLVGTIFGRIFFRFYRFPSKQVGEKRSSVPNGLGIRVTGFVLLKVRPKCDSARFCQNCLILNFYLVAQKFALLFFNKLFEENDRPTV